MLFILVVKPGPIFKAFPFLFYFSGLLKKTQFMDKQCLIVLVFILIFLLVLYHHYIILSWGRFFSVDILVLPMIFMKMDVQISPKFWKVFSHYFFKETSPFSFSSPSGTPRMHRLFFLMISHSLCRLSLFCLSSFLPSFLLSFLL